MSGSESVGDDDTLCPIAHSTGLVGDRWSILIVRELLMGQGRFQDLQAQTGASSQLLAARLKRLEADGLIERHAYSQRPVRHEYRLTPKGRDLMPVILALRAWGEAWCKPGGGTPATRMFHRACDTELELDGRCPACGGLVPWTEMRGQPSEAWAQERGRRAAEFAELRRGPGGGRGG
ncbi:helix-turn-helix domain-containing protein [Phenylobacterium sp.]|uniref:winged helix-turn-helix transcriptional regulator n=1 Tax=Phenylobacterium sp. TaxID=1871053 RepID=UPI0028A0D4C0|nr:helix-turn-helix domain-containing protein [Phenylobacterium sp.]